MRQHTNTVEITGLLQELKIEERVKDGKKYIAGDIVVRVEQEVNHKLEVEEIPVNVWASEITKAQKPNKVFASLQKLIQNGVSIAATGDPLMADKISIGGGNISINSFIPQGATDIVKTPRIRGSFINTVRNNFKPQARFQTEIFIKSIEDEIVQDEPTGRLIVRGVVVQWGEVADIITYVVENPNAIDFIKNNWNPEDTVEVYGAIRYTAKEIVKENDAIDLGFGEPEQKVITKTIKEFVIDKGSASPIDPEFCNSIEDIVAALTKRMEQDEAKKKSSTATPKRSVRDF